MWSLAFGVSALLGSPAPNSLESIVPRWEVDMWAAGLLFSGMFGIASYIWLWWDSMVALRLELSAMLLGIGGTLLYVVAAITVVGAQGIFAEGLVGCWLAANAIRAVQINADIKRLHKWTS